MDYNTPGCSLPVLHHLPEAGQTYVHWVGDAIQPSHPLLLLDPDLNLSQHQGLSNESSLSIRGPKYCSFSFSISPSSEYLGLISFRMNWFDLLEVQETLRSLLQHHSSSVLSFLYGPTVTPIYDYWKNHIFGYMDLCQQSDVSAF